MLTFEKPTLPERPCTGPDNYLLWETVSKVKHFIDGIGSPRESRRHCLVDSIAQILEDLELPRELPCFLSSGGLDGVTTTGAGITTMG